MLSIPVAQSCLFCLIFIEFLFNFGLIFGSKKDEAWPDVSDHMGDRENSGDLQIAGVLVFQCRTVHDPLRKGKRYQGEQDAEDDIEKQHIQRHPAPAAVQQQEIPIIYNIYYNKQEEIEIGMKKLKIETHRRTIKHTCIDP